LHFRILTPNPNAAMRSKELYEEDLKEWELNLTRDITECKRSFNKGLLDKEGLEGCIETLKHNYKFTKPNLEYDYY
jgi:hypothetical protein